MKINFPLFLATIALLGLSAPSVADPTLVGIWYSPFQPDEPNVMSLIEFKTDGTFREEFRKCDNGDFVGYQIGSGATLVGCRTMSRNINADSYEWRPRDWLQAVDWQDCLADRSRNETNSHGPAGLHLRRPSGDEF